MKRQELINMVAKEADTEDTKINVAVVSRVLKLGFDAMQELSLKELAELIEG